MTDFGSLFLGILMIYSCWVYILGRFARTVSTSMLYVIIYIML